MRKQELYHGTTEENVRSIRAKGLLKGTYVTPTRTLAEAFALHRYMWNGERPVLITVTGTYKIVDNPRFIEGTLLTDTKVDKIESIKVEEWEG